jgi:anti-sigma factor RsiW
MPDCREYDELLSAYIDHELAAQDRARVEGHIARCRRCAHELQSLIALKGRIHVAAERVTVPVGLGEGFAARIGEEPAASAPAAALRERRAFWLLPRLVPVAAMAAALIVVAFVYVVYVSRPPGGLTCDEVQRLVPRYVSGDLDIQTALSVSEHLGACPHCEARHLQYASAHAGAIGRQMMGFPVVQSGVPGPAQPVAVDPAQRPPGLAAGR